MQDNQLIREYVQNGSEAAFTQIVERYLNLVYSTCLREMGNAQLAEDATQVTFLILSKRAALLRANTVLPGWLFTIARLTCSNMRRQEKRRAHYEAQAAKEAGMAQETNEATWTEIEPLLQDAIASLRQSDRDAILLRFFQGCSLLETGKALGMSEDAARKRVARAVEKLRMQFARHGVVIPAVLLSLMLADHAANAAPIEVALISQAVVSGAAGSSITSASQGVLKMIWLSRIKTVAMAATCIAGGGAAIIAGTAAHKRPATAARSKPAHVTLTKGAPQQPATDIDGIVLKPDGSPAVGAKIWWSDVTNFDDRPPSVSTTTDAKGQFHFDAKTAWNARPSRNSGGFRFGQAIAQMDGYGISGGGSKPFGAFATTPGAPIIINLTPPATLRTRCVDDTGKPVAHVVIQVQSLLRGGNGVFENFEIPKDLPGTWSAESDADGQVTFSGLPQGWDAQLETEDSRFVRIGAQYPSGRYKLIGATVTGNVPVKLSSAASVEGKVIFGSSGDPAPGVIVMASVAGQSTITGGARTDKDGHYRIDRMQAGKYDMSADVGEPLNEDWIATRREGIALSVGSKLMNADLKVVKGALITGHIIRSGTGKPAARISVYSISAADDGSQEYQGATDENGNFRFRTLAGDIAVAALRQLGAPEHVTVPEGGHAAINMITSAEPQPDAPLTTTYHGLVVDADGNPVPFAELVATGIKNSEPVIWHSDRNGRFTLAVMASPLILLRARLNDAATAEPVRADARTTVKLRLRKHILAEIAGRVEDPAGHPIAGAKMIAFVRDIGQNNSVEGITTDSEGHYRFMDLWPGKKYTVDASAAGFGRSRIMSANAQQDDDLSPVSGEKVEAKTIVLTPATGAVAGHVVDSHGNPLAGAVVAVGIEGPPTTTTDKSGFFRLEGLAPGDIGLTVKAEKEDASMLVHTGKMDEVVRTYPTARGRQWTIFANHQTDLHIGRYAPELPTKGWANTSPVSMSDLKGKYVVFDIFGCCADNVFAMQSMARALADKGVVGIGLYQENETAERLNAHASSEHLKLPLLIDSNGDVAKALGSHATESFVLVGRDGKIISAAYNLDDISETLGKKLAAEQKSH